MITSEITTSIIITATGAIKNKFVGGDLSGAICRGKFRRSGCPRCVQVKKRQPERLNPPTTGATA